MKNKFLSKLPSKKGVGNNIGKDVVDWPSTVNTDIFILYYQQKYTLHINSYNSKKGLLSITVKELATTNSIFISSMRTLKFNTIIPHICNVNWFYNINDTITDENRNLIIQAYDLQKDKNNNNIKYYLYHCLTCGNKDKLSEKSLKKGANCSVCSHTKVVTGINDIATTHPNLCIFFTDSSICKIVSIGTRNSYEVKCPDCCYIKPKKMQPKTLYNSGIACPRCSDGISYPEKFIFSVLEQSGVTFKYQYSPSWANNKFRYDFLLTNYNAIIEANGPQHYMNCFNIKSTKKPIRSLLEEQENDLFKKTRANENNVDKYIPIDCRKSCAKFIKNNILNSPLADLVCLDNIDWDKCAIDAMKSKAKRACDLYNEGFTVIAIAETLKLGRKTIRGYLKNGSKYSLCSYDPKYSIKESFKRPNKRKPTKSVVCLETKKNYNSIKEAALDTGANPNNIGNCCKGKRKTSGGYHWLFELEYKKLSQSEIDSIITKPPFIINLDTLETFYSIKEAKEFYKSNGNITLCCQDKYATACGYRLMYYKDYMLTNL